MGAEEQDKEPGQKPRERESHSGVIADTSAEELALRAQKGSQASFAELVRRYGGSLLIFMQQSTGNLHDAEDLVQDTYVKAYQNIQKYRSSYKFSTWLFTIARRLAVSHYRRREKSQIPNRDSGGDMSPYAAAAERESRQSLWALAGTLSKNQYQALWLKYAEDMSIRDISRVMGKSQVSVKVFLYRARKNLVGRLKNSALHDELPELASWRQNLPFFES